MIDVKMEKGKLIITADIDKNPQMSGSGKSLVLASTRGNMTTEAQYNGKPIVIGLNAYIKN